jgi:hypothetical protein
MTDSNPSWLYDHHTGQAILDGVDARAHALETAWGQGRLRLLVDDELRARFDRQCSLLNAAIREGSLDILRHEARRMLAGWNALDAAATKAGHKHLSPDVWEAVTPDGEVIAITRTTTERRTGPSELRRDSLQPGRGRQARGTTASLGLDALTWPGVWSPPSEIRP